MRPARQFTSPTVHMKSNCITSASHPPLNLPSFPGNVQPTSPRIVPRYFSLLWFNPIHKLLLLERLNMAAPATPFLWKSVRRLRNAIAPRKLGNATINPLSPPSTPLKFICWFPVSKTLPLEYLFTLTFHFKGVSQLSGWSVALTTF